MHAWECSHRGQRTKSPTLLLSTLFLWHSVPYWAPLSGSKPQWSSWLSQLQHWRYMHSWPCRAFTFLWISVCVHGGQKGIGTPGSGLIGNLTWIWGPNSYPLQEQQAFSVCWVISLPSIASLSCSCWERKLRSSCLHSKCSYLLSHLPSSQVLRF